MAILTISIPTYNRPDKLKKLMHELGKYIDTKNIEVNIHDNSDFDIQRANKENTPFSMNYLPNLKNLGYQGNISRCIESANGEYLWLIPDDDEYSFSQINSIIDFIVNENPDVLAVPFKVSRGASNDECIDSFGGVNGCLKDSYSYAGAETYDYLPSAIIKTEILRRGFKKTQSRNNLYFHSLCLLEGCSESDFVIRFPGEAPIKYVAPDMVRFDCRELIDSKLEILNCINIKFNSKLSGKVPVIIMSRWMFFSGLNSTKFIFNKTQYTYIFKLALCYKSIKALIFLILSLFPVSIRRLFWGFVK